MAASPAGRSAESGVNLNPAAWGSDHVGRPVPEYITGDECLFCHRITIGPGWAINRHQSTVRPITLEPEVLAWVKTSDSLESFAPEIEFVLGRSNQMRLLKRAKAYGQLELLSASIQPARSGGKPRLTATGASHWEAHTFGTQCAGCHATGIDARTGTFSAISIECFSCHGNADLSHTKDTTKILLARKRRDPARVVASICASCHIRSGRSQSNARTFPNNFVPGDNLFRDFEVDFSEAALKKATPSDRHVLQNVGDVVVRGREDLTCLSCHSVHRGSSERHQNQPRGEICWNCHQRDSETLTLDWPGRHSRVCEY
jgi:predicted CXXCH cytochrome family protein